MCVSLGMCIRVCVCVCMCMCVYVCMYVYVCVPVSLQDGGLVEKIHPEVNTLYDNFMRGVRLYPKRPCLGEREVDDNGQAGEYRWQTYAEVAKRFTWFGSGLLELTGLQSGAFVGIYSINRPEWVIVEQACNAYSLVPVPLYDTLGASAVQYIINQADIPVTCCEPKVLSLLLSSAPQVGSESP
jgi:long-chain acyl-CoA synthetase